MTAFVILHYRAIDYTRKCVACIKSLEGSKHIIIVDNASPDGTGAALKAEYKGDKEITVRVNHIKDLGSYAAWKATKATGDYDRRTFEVKAVPVKAVPELRPGMSVLLK